MKNRPYLVVLSTTHIIYSPRYLSNMKHILSGIHIPLQLLTNVEGYCFYSFLFYSTQCSSFIFIFIAALLKLFFYYSDIFSLTLHVFHIQVTVSLYGTYHETLLKFFQPLPELSPWQVSKEKNLHQSFKFGYPLNLSNYDAGIFIWNPFCLLIQNWNFC